MTPSSNDAPQHDTTHFGNETVSTAEKQQRVGAVFRSVASRYDLMNDLMSLGIHRCWKAIALQYGAVRAGQTVLDLAGGSGDLTRKLCPIVGPNGQVHLADINPAMLDQAHRRLLDAGWRHAVQLTTANAEQLPYVDNTFDRIFIGFGLRNVTHPTRALASMWRVLKPGGRLIILEFSKPTSALWEQLYDLYSFHLLPKLGQYIAQDEASYRYLVESIRKHPNQETLLTLMKTAGYHQCQYLNLTGGIVAIHRGVKY